MDKFVVCCTYKCSDGVKYKITRRTTKYVWVKSLGFEEKRKKVKEDSYVEYIVFPTPAYGYELVDSVYAKDIV